MTYVPTGQKIYFRGLDDPLKVTSITVEIGYLCWCWIEEAYEITNEDDFNMLDESIRGAIPEETGLFKQITLTFDPWNEKHWIRKRFFGEITGKDAQGNPTYRFHDSWTSPDGQIYATTTNYLCNEWLDEADLKVFQTMKETNPRRYKVAGLGGWGIVDGLIYENWREELFNPAEISAKDGVKSAFGLDFGYRKMFFYGKKCCNGVRWKQSVQNFEGHLFSGTANRRRKVLDQNWKPMKCTHFTLCERGKVRPIDAPHITDRQIHKALCNEVLTPLYGPCMIHDNGASQKGKGLHWHFRRLKEQLHWHHRRYGREGAVLLLDLKGFFPNAPHALLYQRHQELILNPNLRALADTVIQNSPCPTPGRGLPLGVEPSQQEMVALPSAIDNWIKCQAGVHCFGHYMDDYYLIFPDVEALKKLGHEVVRRFEALGIRVNKRKCKIIPLTKPFRFCKARFTLTETGKIKVNGNRDGVKRARRKLKLFHREFLEGKRLLSEVEQFMECQTAYYRNFNDHGRLLRLRRLYHAIFFGGAKCIGSSKTGPTLA